MKLLHGFDPDAGYRRGFVAIGNFDGVHRGHQQMISVLVAQARRDDAPAVALTFNPHPLRLLRPKESPPSLTTLPTKAKLLDDCGVDFVVVMPTTRDLLMLQPEEFFERVLIAEFEARGAVEGTNFRFGRNRAGDVNTLRQLCHDCGMSLVVVPPVTVNGQTVSSSEIRRRIAEGELDDARELLGHPYRIQGTVARGAGRGEDLGFPTANLEGIETLLPGDGVYAAEAFFDDTTFPATMFPAAVHVGPNPTFDNAERKFEVHLIGFEGNLYGRELDVDLLSRIRDVRRFDEPERLQEQLAKDIAAAERIVAAERAER